MKHSRFGCATVDRKSGSRKCLLSPRLPALLALSALIFAAVPASAQKPTYTITATEHFNKKTGTSTYTQTLREKRTGRIIWVRHFPGAGNITWSKDHRAVVFQTGGLTPLDAGFRLVEWKAGGRVTSFFTWPAMLPFRDDYTEDFFWSPDKKHLLFLTGTSGDSAMDIGRIYCLNVKTHQAILVNSSARSPQWVIDRKISYKPIGEAHGHHVDGIIYESSKPRLWRVPKGF